MTFTDYINNKSIFPILHRWHWFNHGGVAPMPQPAADAMRRHAEQSSTGGYNGGKWHAEVEELRPLVAKLINAEAEEIALTKNTGEGISIPAFGLDWNVGDVIVTTGSEYSSNVYPWLHAAERFKLRVVQVKEEVDGRGVRQVPIEGILKAAEDPRCRLVAVSHVQFATGQRLDVARIGAFCRERGILFSVDGIQTVGVLPVDVKAMKIDFLSADSHKWMLGPEGAAFFYCRRELIERIKPHTVGWLSVKDAFAWGRYDSPLKSTAGRFECGTLNYPGFVAMKASVELLLDAGIEQISDRVDLLTTRLTAGLVAKGYTIVSPRDYHATADEWSGIVSFTSFARSHDAIAKTLREQHQCEVVVREGRLRATPHFYMPDASIDHLLAALPDGR